MASEALKQAMAVLTASGEAPELSSQSLAPSKLGTKAHWDDVYQREVNMFKDIGDEGEVWSVPPSPLESILKSFARTDQESKEPRRFGEDSAQDMVEWAEEHFPQTDGRILDGTRNDSLSYFPSVSSRC